MKKITNRPFFVLHEARITERETHPHYSVYGPYKSENYARRIVRDMAVNVHGVDAPAGLVDYTHRHYVTGLLNVHRVSVTTIGRDSRGAELDLAHLARPYPWKA
ncbi:hypothetical protein SEA_CAMERICO_96 [Gordonia phage Camerico]|nr:hypothetical protein SEA_CAMERICO_96 [Gordonia phage Camerico]